MIKDIIHRIAGSRESRVMFLFVMGGLLILSAISVIFLKYQEKVAQDQDYIGPAESEISQEAILLQQRKEKILENSYITSIEFAKEYEEKNDLEVASLKYFDAKSIYPEAVLPRVSLSRVYFQMALEDNSYCWKALKEVLFALRYTRASQHREAYEELIMMEAKLKSMCGEDRKYAFIEQLEALDAEAD